MTVGFSLAFARDAGAPEISFATCQQHFPENFWNPVFQQHANTVSGIAGVVLVAENPSDHHIFLSAFSGVRDLSATSSGITASTPRGDIRVMDPAAFRSHFGSEPPDISSGARLAAVRFRCVSAKLPMHSRRVTSRFPSTWPDRDRTCGCFGRNACI